MGAESAPTFTIWGRKAPPGIQKCLHFAPPFFEICNLNKIIMKSDHKKVVAKSATTYNKQRVQGKNPLLEQHLDGDISNAYLAVNLRSIKAAKTADESCNISCWLIKLNKA